MAEEVLVVGDHAVTIRLTNGQPLTVPYADCRAVEMWRDGARRMWAPDGVTVFLHPSAWIGGPAVIAYWLGSTKPAAIVRASIILYFAISTAIAMVSYLAGGVMTLTVLKLALLVAPAYALGLFIGARLFGVADETLFRRICYALIVIAVVISLPVLDGVIR